MSDRRASVAAARCFLAHFPRFFHPEPRTPLRVLGIIALDTLHVLRTSRRLSGDRVRALARFLDLEGCANAAWDRKDVCARKCRALRTGLNKAGLGLCVDNYLRRLRELESARPSIGGDHRRFNDVREYRESVAWLSITTAAAIALNPPGRQDEVLDPADSDVDTLFRILMQFQIIDDILDYPEDLSAGLPSFITASASVTHGLASTAAAARDYGSSIGASPGSSVFPFRATLRVVTLLTTTLIWTYGITNSRRTHDSIWRWTTTSTK